MSFYGIFIDPTTKKKSYRRYEVFHADKWKPDEVGMLHHFFMKHVPKSRAGVFVYHHDRLYVDEQDELTKLVKPVG